MTCSSARLRNSSASSVLARAIIGPSGMLPCSRAVMSFLPAMKLLGGQIAESSRKGSLVLVGGLFRTASANETRRGPCEVTQTCPCCGCCCARCPGLSAGGVLLARAFALVFALAAGWLAGAGCPPAACPVEPVAGQASKARSSFFKSGGSRSRGWQRALFNSTSAEPRSPSVWLRSRSGASESRTWPGTWQCDV
jgi:hypothetical protein